MVKADYKRDYYADLEVPNNADTETIKKKFRELGKRQSCQPWVRLKANLS